MLLPKRVDISLYPCAVGRDKADPDGNGEISATLRSKAGFNSVSVAECVTATEPPPVQNVTQQDHCLRFSPPAHQFELCVYEIQMASISMPIRGYFSNSKIATSSLNGS